MASSNCTRISLGSPTATRNWPRIPFLAVSTFAIFVTSPFSSRKATLRYSPNILASDLLDRLNPAVENGKSCFFSKSKRNTTLSSLIAATPSTAKESQYVERNSSRPLWCTQEAAAISRVLIKKLIRLDRNWIQIPRLVLDIVGDPLHEALISFCKPVMPHFSFRPWIYSVSNHPLARCAVSVAPEFFENKRIHL